MSEPLPGTRTWLDGARCDHCCNGDRCDDPTHVDRARCPHCLSTGYALWTEAGRAAKAAREAQYARQPKEPTHD